jgi:hypothetical protein
MLEIGISVFLVLAVGYWAILWIMGRRDDVLHGQFVEFEGEDGMAPAMAVPLPIPTPTPRPVAAVPVPDDAALQSLLASIKLELKNASQI